MVTTGSRRVSARIADFLFCNQGVVGSNPTAGTNVIDNVAARLLGMIVFQGNPRQSARLLKIVGARCRRGGVGMGVQPLPALLALIDVERQAALLNAESV
jgi:hypothetical protein